MLDLLFCVYKNCDASCNIFKHFVAKKLKKIVNKKFQFCWSISINWPKESISDIFNNTREKNDNTNGNKTTDF